MPDFRISCVNDCLSLLLFGRIIHRANHRNLVKTRSRIKPRKVKKCGKSGPGLSTPKQWYGTIVCRGKFGIENSIYDMKWGDDTFGTFSPFDATFRLLVFRFLCTVPTSFSSVNRFICLSE
jgi:hypothetical protein